MTLQCNVCGCRVNGGVGLRAALRGQLLRFTSGAFVRMSADTKPVNVLLPGATRSVQVKLQLDTNVDSLLETLTNDLRFKTNMAKLDTTKLEVRVLWKAEPGAPSTKLALATPAAESALPLLGQVHEVGADGSVSATPVAWSILAPRGGYFYVHVRPPLDVEGPCHRRAHCAFALWDFRMH
ncbi:MAG: hypothetical protein EOO65_04595 [Methanosarcinales archaeon]|nr:MAG: hypothetical protein EOO65_04595 [Methanosarcinales archaeon]